MILLQITMTIKLIVYQYGQCEQGKCILLIHSVFACTKIFNYIHTYGC